MTDAFIYDHVRTPRGRGKADGSLHEVTPVELVTQVLEAVKDRNELDTSRVDYWISKGAQPSDRVASILKQVRREATTV